MPDPILPLHSYRATFWPAGIEANDVQEHADKGALPTLRLKARDADHAALIAARVTGQHVFNVERVEAQEATP